MNKQRSLAVESGRFGMLASAVAAALGTGAPIYAQDAVEEVVVTGSRIVRRDLEANSPIVTVDARLPSRA
jgi:iron complex outermembrane receptor protein